MKISNRQFAQALFQATKDKKPAQIKAVVADFAKLLQRHQAINRWPAIARDFAGLWQVEQGEVTVRLTSARPLASATLAALEKELKKITKAERLDWQTTIDEQILVGARLAWSDQVWDLSLDNQLERLNIKLSQ